MNHRLAVFTRVSLYQVVRNSLERAPRLIAMTADAVVSVPLARCPAARSCHACVALQDPYCAWSVDRAACVAVNDLDAGVVVNAAAFAQSVAVGSHRTCGAGAPVETQQVELPRRICKSSKSRVLQIKQSQPLLPLAGVFCPKNKYFLTLLQYNFTEFYLFRN